MPLQVETVAERRLAPNHLQVMLKDQNPGRQNDR